jgi:hypothetical protein
VLNQRYADMLAEVERLLGRKLTIVQGSYRGICRCFSLCRYPRTTEACSTSVRGTSPAAERNAAILAARQVGFAAWYRTEAQGFDPHTHGVAIGDQELPVSAQNQVTQYKQGRNGLASHGADDGPDGYRNVTWESYKAAHNSKEFTVDQADRVIEYIKAQEATKGIEGLRYADLKATVQKLINAESSRYLDYVRRFDAINARLDTAGVAK